MPNFLDALITRSADVDITFVAAVKLFLLFVEIDEALVTKDFDFCPGWRHCVNKPVNVFDFTAGVYKWTFHSAKHPELVDLWPETQLLADYSATAKRLVYITGSNEAHLAGLAI